MSALIKLGAANFAWVLLLTANTRFVNAHFSSNLLIVGVSQVAVSFGYFTLVKGIQGAKGAAAKGAYCAGGAAGAVLGVLITGWVR